MIVFLHEYLLEWLDDLIKEYDISVESIQFLQYLPSLLFLEKEQIRWRYDIIQEEYHHYHLLYIRLYKENNKLSNDADYVSLYYSLYLLYTILVFYLVTSEESLYMNENEKDILCWDNIWWSWIIRISYKVSNRLSTLIK